MTTFESPGVCRVCGCTNDRACEGGCTWANATRSVCSACAFPNEELLFHQMVVEMAHLGEAALPLVFDPVTLFTLVGQLQLALRHPENPEGAAEVTRRFIEQVRASFFKTPALFETIRRGFIAAHDVPREPAVLVPEQPQLILPGDRDYDGDSAA